jgi:hypothetical protein
MALGRVFASVGRRLVTTTTGIVIGTAWVVQAAAPTGPTPPMLRGASDRDALRFPIARFPSENDPVTVQAAPVSRNDGEQALAAIEGAVERSDVLAFGPTRVPRQLAATVLRAAAATATSPVYLMALADKESSFRPDVQAPTSTATGLFQFIDATWLQMVREFGPAHGLGEEARQIEIVDGRYTIVDPDTRARVLALRRDPYLAAVMAAEMHRRDQTRMAQRVQRDFGPVDLYLMHFFGPTDAERFFRALGETPDAAVVQLFPAPARANRGLFTRPNPRPTRRNRAPVSLTVAELYQRIDALIQRRVVRYGGALVTTGLSPAVAGAAAAMR